MVVDPRETASSALKTKSHLLHVSLFIVGGTLMGLSSTGISAFLGAGFVIIVIAFIMDWAYIAWIKMHLEIIVKSHLTLAKMNLEEEEDDEEDFDIDTYNRVKKLLKQIQNEQ